MCMIKPLIINTETPYTIFGFELRSYKNNNSICFKFQVNFVICQLVALCIAPLIYKYLPPINKHYVLLREVSGLIIGLSMAYVCFGL